MEGLEQIDREAGKDSFMNSLDGRIKLISSMLIIIYAVYSTNLLILVIMEIYLLILISLSNVSPKYALKRIALILPFGGFIALIQPFFQPGNIIWTGPFGWLHITDYGLFFGALLLSRVTVSVTSIVFLSSSTSMQDLVASAQKLGVPHQLAMLLNLTVRYLFFFYDQLMNILNAQATRCFDIFNKKTTYKWRLRKVGETITMMFLRAFEQGETVYLSMMARGYSDNTRIYRSKVKLDIKDFAFIGITLTLIASLQLVKIFFL
ncbi:MAG: cobalt ECF transporter T component CbiQ [Methanobacteriaceae archaeon]|nr:cobalt ECF transporter T component CbiQ [Methanobacteriaceae archaeon]